MNNRIPVKRICNIYGDEITFNVVQESKCSWYAYGTYNSKSIEAKGSTESQAKENWKYKAELLGEI